MKADDSKNKLNEKERKKSLIIVDDEISLLTTLKFIFEDNGFDVVMAGGGVEALEIMTKRTFDMAILDINMPEMDGLQTFREIKKNYPSTAVFMMTGNKESSQVKKCIEEGAITVVYKPFSVNNLLEVMDKVARKPVVLIVDDRGDDRVILRSALEIHDYRIIEAKDGADAIEKVKKGNFDICLIDYKMPGMNGIETIENIKKVSPDANMVLVSAYTLEEAIKSELKEQKGVAFLKKPFEINNLVDIIKEETSKKKKTEQ